MEQPDWLEVARLVQSEQTERMLGECLENMKECLENTWRILGECLENSWKMLFQQDKKIFLSCWRATKENAWQLLVHLSKCLKNTWPLFQMLRDLSKCKRKSWHSLDYFEHVENNWQIKATISNACRTLGNLSNSLANTWPPRKKVGEQSKLNKFSTFH